MSDVTGAVVCWALELPDELWELIVVRFCAPAERTALWRTCRRLHGVVRECVGEVRRAVAERWGASLSVCLSDAF
jgi:hypothetical protein